MSEAVNGVTMLSAAIKRALKADVQFLEPYGSSAFNRKMSGIIAAGIYTGFKPVLAGGMNVTITSRDEVDQRGTASIDVGEYQITVHQFSDVTLTIPPNATTRVMLEANYQFGVKTDQVDSNSPVPAVRIFLADASEQENGNQLELCRFVVPADTEVLTLDMMVLAHRKMQALGITLSSEIDSDREDIAATPNAVNKLRNKLTGENAPASLNTIALLAAAINNDPNFYETLEGLLALKAPLNNPALSGIPTAPTASPATNTTQIATTAFVKAAIASLVDSSPETMDTLAEIADALNNDPHFATTMLNQLGGKQPLDATLTALAGLATSGNMLPYFTGNDTMAQTPFTAVAREILAASTKADVLSLLGAVKRAGDEMTGELKTTSANSFRMKLNGKGSFWRFDGTTQYLMFTKQNDADGTYNELRPFSVNAATGDVHFGHNVTVQGGFSANGVQSTTDIFLASDNRQHIVFKNADGTARAYIYKDRNSDLRINNGVEGGGDFAIRRDGSIGWGTLGSTLYNDGNLNGSAWGGWLSNYLNSNFTAINNNIDTRAVASWVQQNFVTDVALGAEGSFIIVKNAWQRVPAGCVLTGYNAEGNEPVNDTLFYRPIQKYIPAYGWMTVGHTA